MFSTALLSGCNGSALQSTSPVDIPEALKITLDRGVCFGQCPSYVVEINGDGSVNYCGVYFVEKHGLHSAQVDPAEVLALYNRIEASGFFKFKDEYRGLITDLPTYVVSVSKGTQSKRIVDYAGGLDGMPQVISEIQREIDELAGVDAWIGQGSAEQQYDVPVCEADFRRIN